MSPERPTPIFLDSDERTDGRTDGQTDGHATKNGHRVTRKKRGFDIFFFTEHRRYMPLYRFHGDPTQ